MFWMRTAFQPRASRTSALLVETVAAAELGSEED